MRTSNKPTLLLDYLAREKRKPLSLKKIAEVLQLKRNQVYKILCSLQEQGKLCIKKSITDKRKHYVVLQEENKMARLRKREIITPSIDREAFVSGLKKTMNRRMYGKRKEIQETIRIPDSVLEVINHWNSFDCVPKIKVPTPVNGAYLVTTKILKQTINSLKRLLTGNFFSKIPIIELREQNQNFTIEEVKDTITNYCKSAYSTNYLPYDKKYLEGKRLIDVLYCERAAYLKSKSLFMYFFHNPPELMPVIAAQKAKTEKENIKEQKIQKVSRDKDNLEWLEEELIRIYDKHYGIESVKERKELKEASLVLYDFAEQHGGLNDPSKWAWYAVDALMWRKEKGGRFNAHPKTLLQDWFYNSVMLDYFVFKGLDNYLYLPEIHGEIEPISYSSEDKPITMEEYLKIAQGEPQ